jgi:8-oxo-dGTP diphosphatase
MACASAGAGWCRRPRGALEGATFRETKIAADLILESRMAQNGVIFSLTVEIVIFTVQEAELRVLLVRRGIEPFAGHWAIPGGLVLERESVDDAARRELEEAGVRDVYLEQLYTFGDPGRVPGGRVVTVAYFALLAPEREIRRGRDAAETRWHAMRALPSLAFDHEAILTYALARLRNKLEYTTVGFELLQAAFTLGELQAVYEAILGRPLDNRNFRRKIDLLGILTPIRHAQRPGRTRPAQLYRFSAARFEKLRDKGILFPF